MTTQDWQGFVLAHGWRARVHHLATVLQQPPSAINHVRAAGCTPQLKPKEFAELFAIWHGRPPRDNEWPAPVKRGSTYEVLPPELALVATLVGAQSTDEIAAVLTQRLCLLTCDMSAVRSRADVQRMRSSSGLVATDVQGGLTVSQAVKRAGRKDVTRVLLQQEIYKGRLRRFQVGRLSVIPARVFDEWLAARLPEPPDGWIKLWDIEEQLGFSRRSESRPSWYAKQGLIPGALFCAGHRWWVSPAVAEDLIRRRRAGLPMPWSGYSHPSCVKRSYALWRERKHRACAECRAIWATVGGEPRTFEAFFERWRKIPEATKRHLTKPDGLSAIAAAARTGVEKHTIADAILNGILPARRIRGHWAIRPADLDRWVRRRVLTTNGGVRRLHHQPLTFKHAASRSRLSEGTLRRAVAAGTLTQVTRWDGRPGLLAHQVAGLRARVGGYSVADAAGQLGVSAAAFLQSAKICGWQPGFAITRALVYAVKKHREAPWQLTIAQAAKRLRKSAAWVRRAIAAGAIMPLRGLDRRTIMVGRKAIAAMIRGGIPELPVTRRGRPVLWLQQTQAADHAGVTASTIIRWKGLGDLVVEERIDGPYYTKTSVERRARQYWTTECHRKRAVPPAWLQASTTEAA